MNEYSGFSQKLATAVISQAQSGDTSAMEKIYLTYSNPCYTLAYRITHNRTLSQDIVHEIFLKIIKNLTRYNSSGPFAGWVRKIAVNESVNALKKNTKLFEVIEFKDDIEAANLFEHRWWEACKDLKKLTVRLSDDARAVLFLHEIEGYSHKEIAAFFGKSESFSKQSLSRTMYQLKSLNAIKEIKNASHR